LFFKDSAHTFIVRVFGYLLAFSVQVMIARFLGPGAKGELQIAMFLFSIVGMLIGLGFERAIIFYLGRGRYDLKRIWHNACAFLLVSTVFAVIVLLPLTYLAMPLFGEISFGLLALVFVMAPLNRFMSFQLGIFNGRGEIRKGNIFTFQNSLIYAVLVALFLIWFLPRSSSVLLAYSCSFFITIITVLIYWRNNLKGLGLGISFERVVLKHMLSFGTRGQIGNITNVIATRLDLLLMNYYLGKASAGIYSVAINFSELIMFLPLILSYVIFPHASRRTQEQGWHLIQQTARISFLISLCLALVIAVLAPIAIPILFSETFIGALQPLWILLCGMIFLAVFRILASGISGLGHPLIYSICTISAVIVSLVLNLILVPKYQEIGAAVSNAIAYFIAFVILIAFIKFKFRQSLHKFLIVNKGDLNRIIESTRRLFKQNI
jgi:O-antigen/teichoic acid export membrane protein